MKSLLSLFVAAALTLSVNAQTAKTTSSKQEVKAKTETKNAAKPAKTEAKATAKTTATSTEKKPRDGRTKTGDPIDKTLHGPSGETVYSGPKGGFYYLDKKENKVYLKK